ncbi:unnamed protein product [Prorocentrum cordatum]|uniref:Uncharacterized protein n=1 Tax=Prorocentrum cordatum TaxID=2364126 RepID=A0ABN9Q500_9DINO|nr:unnamed protein product [Polarella glacialis]
MRELRDQLALAEARPRVPLAAVPQGFERDVEATVVVIMCQASTTKQPVGAAFTEWLAEFGFPESEYEIPPVGLAPCKKFLLKFSGLVAVASRKVLRVLSRLRVDGARKEFHVDAPGVARARMHLGPDKNPRQIKIEVLPRRCRPVIAGAHPNVRLYSDRDRGTLSAGWDRIVGVEVVAGAAPATIMWGPTALLKYNLRKDNLVQITRHRVAPQAEPHWCL